MGKDFEGIVKPSSKKKKIVKKILREVGFKSGWQFGPEFYSLQVASLDRMLDLKTRSGGGPVIVYTILNTLYTQFSIHCIHTSQYI